MLIYVFLLGSGFFLKISWLEGADWWINLDGKGSAAGISIGVVPRRQRGVSSMRSPDSCVATDEGPRSTCRTYATLTARASGVGRASFTSGGGPSKAR